MRRGNPGCLEGFGFLNCFAVVWIATHPPPLKGRMGCSQLYFVVFKLFLIRSANSLRQVLSFSHQNQVFLAEISQACFLLL